MGSLLYVEPLDFVARPVCSQLTVLDLHFQTLADESRVA